MCENLHYESVYFKELQYTNNIPTTYRVGAAVVSNVTSNIHCTLFLLFLSGCALFFSQLFAFSIFTLFVLRSQLIKIVFVVVVAKFFPSQMREIFALS